MRNFSSKFHSSCKVCACPEYVLDAYSTSVGISQKQCHNVRSSYKIQLIKGLNIDLNLLKNNEMCNCLYLSKNKRVASSVQIT